MGPGIYECVEETKNGLFDVKISINIARFQFLERLSEKNNCLVIFAIGLTIFLNRSNITIAER
jgi:hypothetical protein